jgi:hypothetical protein
MIRIPRTELDYAVATLVACAKAARDKQGLRIKFPLSNDQAERLIIASLGAVAPGTIPQLVMPMDVHEIDVGRHAVQYGPSGVGREQLAARYGLTVEQVDEIYGTRPEDDSLDAPSAAQEPPLAHDVPPPSDRR